VLFAINETGKDSEECKQARWQLNPSIRFFDDRVDFSVPGLLGRRESDVASSTGALAVALIYAQIPGLMTKEYNVISAIPAGIRLTGETIGGYLDDLKMVATPSTGAYKSVGSFIAIGQVFPGTWDWYQFLYLLGLLSIMLGVMNLLPIPGLDGGHILFTIYEMITGRKPSDKFLIVAQMIGMVLLLMLMMLAFGNDIGRLIR